MAALGGPGLSLRPSLVDTTDGLAKYPYVRESRRIRAKFTVVEEHVSTEARMEETGLKRDEVRAASFPDSVGLGCYRIDLHPSTGGDNYIDLSSLPFEIPLGAWIPERVKTLIAGAKNLGVTHITNGCYRLHPVEWNVGESAGALAAHCMRTNLQPVEVQKDADETSRVSTQTGETRGRDSLAKTRAAVEFSRPSASGSWFARALLTGCPFRLVKWHFLSRERRDVNDFKHRDLGKQRHVLNDCRGRVEVGVLVHGALQLSWEFDFGRCLEQKSRANTEICLTPSLSFFAW